VQRRRAKTRNGQPCANPDVAPDLPERARILYNVHRQKPAGKANREWGEWNGS